MTDEERILAEKREETRRLFADKIAWMKRLVGTGIEISNGLVRVCLSAHGGWYEFQDVPEEFSAWVGTGTTHRFIGELEAKALTQMVLESSLRANKQNTRKLQLFVAYGTDVWTVSHKDVYVCVFDAETAIPRSGGDPAYRGIPLFLKLKAESTLPPLNGEAKIIIFFSKIGDQNLLVEIPYSQAADLSKVSLPTIH